MIEINSPLKNDLVELRDVADILNNENTIALIAANRFLPDRCEVLYDYEIDFLQDLTTKISHHEKAVVDVLGPAFLHIRMLMDKTLAELRTYVTVSMSFYGPIKNPVVSDYYTRWTTAFALAIVCYKSPHLLNLLTQKIKTFDKSLEPKLSRDRRKALLQELQKELQ